MNDEQRAKLEANVADWLGDCAEPANGWDDIPEGKQCFAITHDGEFVTGATKRIAVCRAVVLAKLGTSVEVPAVLVAQ